MSSHDDSLPSPPDDQVMQDDHTSEGEPATKIKLAPKKQAQDYDFDVFVIGSGPGGQRAAIQASKLGKRAAIAEVRSAVGGAQINTGTIPSKTLREAALHLSGYRERSIYGASHSNKRHITMGDLLYRTDFVIRNELDVTRHQLQRNGIHVLQARAELVDPHTVRLTYTDGRGHRELTADKIVIATGTTTNRGVNVPFDGQRVFTSDDVLRLDALPHSLAIAGAGVIGCEYATIFASLGVRVTLIDKQPRLLPFIDGEIVDALIHHMRQNRLTLRLGEEISGFEPFSDEKGDRVRILLNSGKKIIAERALYCMGRQGATDNLNLDAAGVRANERGLIPVNEDYQTITPNIYAVGDVVGFPSLASTSMEQGRHAACHAFNGRADSLPDFHPYGIYTIPEISICGKNEEELTAAGVPYEVGKASYKEIARGQIMGDSTGLLKLLFHLQTRKLLGVSILGDGASELVHIGQAVLTHGGSIDYFVRTVFNYPTLAECYKTAAFDGLNRLE
jgi:NAD(P) transhydrogenase